MFTITGESERFVSYPSSLAQESFWQRDADRPGDPAYHVSLRWKIVGELKQSTLETAWQQLIARHEILRTRFERRGGELCQIVEDEVDFHIAVVDCSVLEKNAIEAEIGRVAHADSRRAFDLTKAPLVRLTRVVVDATTSVLLVSAHHIVCDGWSFGILAREMGAICDALQHGRRATLSELVTTFGTFARWQRGALTADALAEELALLRNDFANASPFSISTDRPRPERWSSNVRTASRVLDYDATTAFANEARALGSTSFMTMLAATVAVLGERSPAAKVTLTTQVACRDEVDIEGVVGPFVNTVPLQFDLARSRQFSDLVGSVGDAVANALELRHVPFDAIAETLFGAIRPGHGAHLDVNFVYQKAFTADATYPNFGVLSEHSRPGGSFCDLNIYVVERPTSWRVSCDYNPDLYDERTVESLLERFGQVVSNAVDPRDTVLFFHSDLFASGYYAEEIAASIPEFRIVPVAPHGTEGLPLPLSIDGMAQDYLERLGELQPRGPYRLIGFCSGGQVAYEVARRLRARNEVVEEVILINATAPARPLLAFRDRLIVRVGTNAKIGIGLREAICYNVARLNRALLRGPVATAAFLYRTAGALLRRRGFESQLQPGESYRRTQNDPRSEISLAHISAVLTHHPHTYDGSMTLIWSRDQRSLTGEPTQGWVRLARDVAVIPMSGGHVAPLHTLVGELSSILRETLTANRARASKVALDGGA